MASAAIRSRRPGRSPAFSLVRGKARRVATAGATSSGVAGSPSSTLATASTHSRGTASAFKFDQAMACRLLRRAAGGAKASRSRAARSRWIGAAWANRPSWRSSSARSAGGKIDPHQPFTEDTGQRNGPVTMPADDPGRRLLEARLRRGQQPRDEFRVETAAIHLVERDHRGLDRSWVFARKPGLGPFRVADLDQCISERMLENAIVCFSQRPPGAPARPTCRRFVPAPRPRRGGSGPTAIASSSISPDVASRSRQRPATWIAAWRTVSSGSLKEVADQRPRAGMVDPGERPDGVAAQQRGDGSTSCRATSRSGLRLASPCSRFGQGSRSRGAARPAAGRRAT